MRTEINFGTRFSDCNELIEAVNFMANFSCHIVTIKDGRDTVIEFVYNGKNMETFRTNLFNKYPTSKIVTLDYTVEEGLKIDNIVDIFGIEFY